MSAISLQDTLAAATSLLDLAQRLGERCLDSEQDLNDGLADADVRAICKAMAKLVEEIPPDDWEHYGDSGFGMLLTEQGLEAAVERAEAEEPLEFLGFLWGLCAGPLERYVVSTEDRIQLAYGTPIRFAIRPIKKRFKRATTYQPTLASAGLMRAVPYSLFRSKAISTTLDYRHRHRLDELTWSGKERLPRVTTVHPLLESADMYWEPTDDTFFAVRPREPREEDLLAQLRAGCTCEIGVLPELVLQHCDAVERELESKPELYPKIVVAGSAHVESKGAAGVTRANESRVYIDGQLVSRHCKIHPFKLKVDDTVLTEGISGKPREIHVLSGRYTRMAVVICSDINNDLIPPLLLNVGVNLLLVPSRTVSDGSFGAILGPLASSCQGVCVIANVRLDEDPSEPFMLLVSVPRPITDGQVDFYRDPTERAISRAVFDPNLELDKAVSWP